MLALARASPSRPPPPSAHRLVQHPRGATPTADTPAARRCSPGCPMSSAPTRLDPWRRRRRRPVLERGASGAATVGSACRLRPTDERGRTSRGCRRRSACRTAPLVPRTRAASSAAFRSAIASSRATSSPTCATPSCASPTPTSRSAASRARPPTSRTAAPRRRACRFRECPAASASPSRTRPQGRRAARTPDLRGDRALRGISRDPHLLMGDLNGPRAPTSTTKVGRRSARCTRAGGPPPREESLSSALRDAGFADAYALQAARAGRRADVLDGAIDT